MLSKGTNMTVKEFSNDWKFILGHRMVASHGLNTGACLRGWWNVFPGIVSWLPLTGWLWGHKDWHGATQCVSSWLTLFHGKRQHGDGWIDFWTSVSFKILQVSLTYVYCEFLIVVWVIYPASPFEKWRELCWAGQSVCICKIAQELKLDRSFSRSFF